MIEFLKKLFGFGAKKECCGACNDNDDEPLVKLGPEPTTTGFVAQEIVKAMPEAVWVEQRPEVTASAPAAWPFPVTKPEEGKPAAKKKPAKPKQQQKKAPAQPAKPPAVAKPKPAAKTVVKKKKPARPPAKKNK